jgi:hypothetical protein
MLFPGGEAKNEVYTAEHGEIKHGEIRAWRNYGEIMLRSGRAAVIINLVAKKGDEISEKAWPVGQGVKTPPFHGGNRGSNPLRVTMSH